MIARPPAIYVQADQFELARCRCPSCLILDARYPGQGYQMALFPYIPSRRPRRRR